MNANAILAFIKKHVIALSLGLVAIVAVVVALFILPGWFAALQTQLTARAAAHTSAADARQRGTALVVPALSLTGQPEPLNGGYPTQEARTRVIEAVTNFTNQISSMVDD